ncbi:MAG TPA: glycosyltransferase, partial [Solirubrobacteraceae bacterium]|nr:glycosyltransferase [Solirubrobacteraceae bacterium]
CVLCFGFLAPYKGIETVLESARQTGPRVQVVVAGGEHPRLAAGGDRYAEQLRAQHGDHARFTGHVPDAQVGPWFAAADLAVFMYPRPFSSSGALALAIAHGTPVLTSAALARTAGLPDALATADRAALTARLDRLAQNRTELAPLRAATAHLAAERSWAAVAARHLELYREAADGPRTARR